MNCKQDSYEGYAAAGMRESRDPLQEGPLAEGIYGRRGVWNWGVYYNRGVYGNRDLRQKRNMVLGCLLQNGCLWQ